MASCVQVALWCVVHATCWAGVPESQAASRVARPIPFVKQWSSAGGSVPMAAVGIRAESGLENEVEALKESLGDLGIAIRDEGTPVRLRIADVPLPELRSQYRGSIGKQAYRLRVRKDGVQIEGASPAGVFYGIQTLRQMITADKTAPEVDILDWPDLPVRMVMVDSARQNETPDYYRRLIQFLARYKINTLHWHLTDDEILCLYHEDYPWLMHPRAWRLEPIGELVRFARRHHIEVLPEVESLGHARVFAKHPEYRDILHQTTFDKPSRSWAGTDVPGYTNVLCPASEKTYIYLQQMYERAAQGFPYPSLHIGCDEVEMTSCRRCEERFGSVSPGDWFARHMLRCRDLAAGTGRGLALWGDMLLHHREAVDKLPRENVTIFDWHYNGDVTPDSARFFKEKGFDVVACPALVCHPRMILPDDENYENIRRFAEIARDLDLRGLDTTIWTPIRYLSDVLWPGIAYAAVHSWSGGNWDEDGFYARFAQDFFGLAEGAAFERQWKALAGIRWRLEDFYRSCWIDESTLEAARSATEQQGEQARDLLRRVREIETELSKLRPGVRRNAEAWTAIERSAAIRAYTMEHFLAAPRVRTDQGWNRDMLRGLDESCVQAIRWIEEDWDRNRFADDPNKDGAYRTTEHLLWRFKQMHNFHERLLLEKPSTQGGETAGFGGTQSRRDGRDSGI